jgi:hypothetical protein
MNETCYSVIHKGQVLAQFGTLPEAVERAKVESCVGDRHGNTSRPVSVQSGPLHEWRAAFWRGVTKHVCYDGGRVVG